MVENNARIGNIIVYLISNIESNFIVNYCRFYPGRHHSTIPIGMIL